MRKELAFDVQVVHKDGRKGKIVEINTVTGRARVAWPDDTKPGRYRRTWVRFMALTALTIEKPGVSEVSSK